MTSKESVANVATLTTISSGTAGFTGWVDEHYQLLMLSVTVLSFLTAALFYWLNYRENVRRTDHLTRESPSPE